MIQGSKINNQNEDFILSENNFFDYSSFHEGSFFNTYNFIDGDSEARNEYNKEFYIPEGSSNIEWNTNIRMNIPNIEETIDFILMTTRKKGEMVNNRGIKRIVKTPKQLKILSRELKKNSIISKDRLRKIAEKIGLKSEQVYKWYWDQKKKKSLM